MSGEFHIPVLSNEAVAYLINPDITPKKLVDATLGGGGYTKLILEMTGPEDEVIAIDKDLNAIKEASRLTDKYGDRLKILNGNFGELDALLLGQGIVSISGVVMDLGLSSYQLEHEDGFSYMRNTRLDMRAFANDSLTAEIIINTYSQKDLELLFEKFGEIGNSKRLAKAICASRRKSSISTTAGLAEVVDNEYKLGRKNRMDFLSKIFQALRIEVNNELNNLEKVLEKSVQMLETGGRIVTVSYHSLEDRIVKNFFRENSRKTCNRTDNKSLRLLTKKPVIPGRQEIRGNRRSRSAKLRAAEVNQIQ